MLVWPLNVSAGFPVLYNNIPQLTAQYVQVLRDSNARNNLYSRGAANALVGAKPNIAAEVPAIPPAQTLKNFLLEICIITPLY